MEFSFTNKLLFERRLVTLSEREDYLEQRLSSLYSRKLTDKRFKKIKRTEGILDRVRTRIDDTEDFLTNFPKPEVSEPSNPSDPLAPVAPVDPYVADKYEFSPRLDTFVAGGTFTVTDSLTDNTYKVGDQLRVQVHAQKPFSGRKITFNTLEGDVDGNVITFTFGDSLINEMASGYDTLTFKTIDEEGNTIFSSGAIDVTNIG